MCYLAYGMSAWLGREWGLCGEHQEVVRLLRGLQTIRLGGLRFGDSAVRPIMTGIPPDQEEALKNLKLHRLFQTPPARAAPKNTAL